MNDLHYDEAALFELATVSPARRSGRVHMHVGSCSRCAELVASIESFSAALSDPEVWEIQDPDPLLAMPDEGRIYQLQELETRLSMERTVAAMRMSVLLGLRSAERTAALRESPQLQTAGGAQKLLELAHERVENDALFSLTLAVAATSIVAELDRESYPPQLLSELSGSAFREQAVALRYLGRYAEGLDRIDRAEEHFRQGASNPGDLARTAYQKACLFLHAERIDEALPLMRESAKAFLDLGDTKHYLQTVVLDGAARFRSGDVRGAVEFWLSIEEPMRRENPDGLHAFLCNIAHGLVALGDLDSAGRYFAEALEIEHSLGLDGQLARVQWGAARMLVASGRWEEAIARFEKTASELLRLEMPSAAATVRLEAADLLLAMNRPAQANAMCRDLVSEFTRAGMTSSAIAAVAFLDEASKQGKLNAERIRHVRRFLERLPRSPGLLFAPPPLPVE